MRETRPDWKNWMEAFLKGIESELRPSPPPKVRAKLQAFQKRLERDCVGRRRKRFERELEFALQTDPFLRRASERHLSKIVPAAVASALETLEKAERILKQYKKPKRQLVN